MKEHPVMVSLNSDLCVHCQHYRGFKGNPPIFTCSAFPKGVPGIVSNGNFDHRKPYPGDNGIQFEIDEKFLAILEREGKLEEWYAEIDEFYRDSD